MEPPNISVVFLETPAAVKEGYNYSRSGEQDSDDKYL